MKIGLIDVDGHHFPNLPLMKLSAWHKANGDSVEWYQPLFSGHLDIVYMSKVFSFTPDYEYFIDADQVVKGGSGYAIRLEGGREYFNAGADNSLPPEIEHIYPDYSLYPEETEDKAYGFLTRGCPRGCSFCHVKEKEGRMSYKAADLEEFWRGQKKIVLCDPNILACKEHMGLLRQLADSGAKVDFNQGLDIRLVNDQNMELLKQIRVDKIHFSFDRWEDRDVIEPKLRDFVKQTGFSRGKGRVTVFILMNYDTTVEQDLYRIQLCRELNISPYPMIYDKEHADRIYRRIQRWCNNNCFWSVKTFEEYSA